MPWQLGQAGRVDRAGVHERVGIREIHRARERHDRAKRGQIAGGEEQRAFATGPRRKLPLERFVFRRHAAKKSRAAAARDIRAVQRGDDTRIATQTEVVIRRKVDYAVGMRVRSVRRSACRSSAASSTRTRSR